MSRLFNDRPLYIGSWPTLLVGALATAFALKGIHLYRVVYNPFSVEAGVLYGAVAGFIVHELAHREVARRQGCIAGFVLSSFGLMITLLSGLINSLPLHFKFAIIAPGYVSILCYSSWAGYRREDLIAAVGPASNIVLALIAHILAPLTPTTLIPLLIGFKEINAWIAFFNLLPLEPLDGAKILKQNPILWIVMLLFALILLV